MGRYGVAATIAIVVVASATTTPAAGTTSTLDLRVRGQASESAANGSSSGSTVPFAGTLRCGDGGNRATGDFAGRAARLCARARHMTAVFRRLDRPNTRLCSQIYSGPEHARVTGTLDGTRIDIAIARSDGCGTADWQQLQWLLGPPVR